YILRRTHITPIFLASEIRKLRLEVPAAPPPAVQKGSAFPRPELLLLRPAAVPPAALRCDGIPRADRRAAQDTEERRAGPQRGVLSTANLARPRCTGPTVWCCRGGVSSQHGGRTSRRRTVARAQPVADLPDHKGIATP